MAMETFKLPPRSGSICDTYAYESDAPAPHELFAMPMMPIAIASVAARRAGVRAAARRAASSRTRLGPAAMRYATAASSVMISGRVGIVEGEPQRAEGQHESVRQPGRDCPERGE